MRFSWLQYRTPKVQILFPKRGFVLCLMLLFTVFSHSLRAATFTWVGTLGSAWNNPLNWNNLLAGFPDDPSDVAIIGGGLLGSPVLDANRNIGSLTINGSGNLNLNGRVLSLSGNFTTQAGAVMTNGRLVGTGTTANINGLTTNARVQLNYATFTNILGNAFQDSVSFNKTTSAITNSNNNGNDFTGITTVTNGSASTFRFTNNNFSKLIINSNSTGALEFSHTGASVYNGDVIINTATTGISFGAGGGTSTMNAGFGVSTGTYTNGNSAFTAFTQNGTTSNALTLAAGNITFTNCSFGGSMNVTATSNASLATFTNTVCSNSVSMNVGGFVLSSNTFNQAGGSTNITKSGSTIDDITNNNNTFWGPTSIVHNGAGRIIRFSGTTGNTFKAALTLNNANSGTLQMAHVANDVYEGNITLSSTSSGMSFGGAGGTSTMSAGRSLSTGSYTAGNSSFTAFTQNGAAASSLTMAAGNITFANCDLGGSLTLTATNTASVATLTNSSFRNGVNFNVGAMVLTNNIFNQSGGSTAITKTGTTIDDLNLNGNTFSAATNFTHNGGARTVRFSSATGNTFTGDLTITNSSSGPLQFAYTANDTYGGNIVINTTSTGISFGANGGASTQAAGRAVNSGTYSGGSSSFNLFTQNGTSSSTLTLTGGNVAITSSSFGGNMVVTAVATQTCTFTNSVFNRLFTVISGGVSINNCTFNQNGGTTSITTTGPGIDSPNNGGNTFYGVTAITNNTGSASRHLYFANTSGDTYYSNAAFDNGGISILSPVRNGTSSFYGNIEVHNTTAGVPIVFGDGTGIVQMLGTASAQILSNNVSGPIFDDLIINKTSGVVSLNGASATINNSLALTSGVLNLNNQALVINNAAAGTLSRTNGFVLSGTANESSRIQWNIGSNAGSRVFPFGKADGTMVPVTMNLTAGNIGNLSVYTYSTAADNTPYATPVDNMNSGTFNGDASVDHVVDRFWKISKTGPSGISTQTFTYADNEIPLSGEAALFAQVWTSEWQIGVGVGNALTNSVTAVGVTDYSHWTLVNVNYFLPVQLISFEAEKSESSNVLKWEITGEDQLTHYNVERSEDGVHFETFEKVTSVNARKYNTVDNIPFHRSTYYRLAMIGKESEISYSNVLKINSSLNFSLYPNPSNGNEIFIHWESESKDVLVVLQDVMGRVIYEKMLVDINHNGDVNFLTGFDKLESGIYMVVASSANELIKKKVIVK